MQTTITSMCRFGSNCRYGTKCQYGHTDEHKQIFAAKQAAKYKNTRPCFQGSRCCDEKCTHAHDKNLLIEALNRVGLKHEIQSRCKEFDQVEIDLGEIDKVIEEDLQEFRNTWNEFIEELEEADLRMVNDADEPEEFTTGIKTPTKKSVEQIAPGAPKKASVERWCGDLEKLRNISWADL
jgi:hypothetical protein